MRIRFWGTRGSLARPGLTTARYGGNTACVELRGPDGTLIVLDCGTGAYELGRHLVSAERPPVRGHLLITHTHWDHIQGFPFHHDPLRDDAAVDRIVDTCRDRAGRALEVVGAAEGQVIELAGPAGVVPAAAAARAPGVGIAASATTILVAAGDAELLELVTDTLEPEGYRLLRARDGEEALALARAEQPDLLLLDWRMPGRDGLAVCRTLRASDDPRLRDVPVVLLTGEGLDREHTEAGFAAGVTDDMTKPFKPAHLRTRVTAWLLRRAAREGA